MADSENRVRLPGIRDVMRHLVHHAPDLSPEMRDQYRAAIDQEYPAPVSRETESGEPQANRDELPPPPAS